jgi:hypothetical protein
MVGELAAVEPVLPVMRGPDEAPVGLLPRVRRRVLGPRKRGEQHVALLDQRARGRARPLEAEVHVARQPQLRARAVAARDRLVVVRARVLPAGVLAAVAERRLAVEVDLHLTVDAADHPQQHVVGVVGRRRPLVRVRAVVLVVPGPDQQDVADDDPAALGVPARLEHHRPRQVAPRSRHQDAVGAEAEHPGVAIEDRTEHARGVEPREAHPVHVAARRDERARLAVRQERVVGDGRERARAEPRRPGVRAPRTSARRSASRPSVRGRRRVARRTQRPRGRSPRP